MACYEFYCESCETLTQADYPIGTAPASITCPHCGMPASRYYTPVDFRMLVRGKGYVDATGKPTGKRHPADPHPDDYQTVKPYTIGY